MSKIIYKHFNDFEVKPEINFEARLKEEGRVWGSSNGFCFDDEGKVCIVYEEAKGCWGLPGGGKKDGETPLETFIREVKEEAQADATEIVYFHATYGYCYDENGVELKYERTKLGMRFICKLENIKEYIPHLGGHEIDERKFVVLDELPNYVTWLQTENGQESFAKLKEFLKTKE